MHDSFNESNHSKENKVVVCDDDDLVEVPIERYKKMIMLNYKDNKMNLFKRRIKMIFLNNGEPVVIIQSKT